MPGRNNLELLSRIFFLIFFPGIIPGEGSEDALGVFFFFLNSLFSKGGRDQKWPITAGLGEKSTLKRRKNWDFLSLPFPGKGFGCPRADEFFNLFSADFILKNSGFYR